MGDVDGSGGWNPDFVGDLDGHRLVVGFLQDWVIGHGDYGVFCEGLFVVGDGDEGVDAYGEEDLGMGG